MAGETLPGHGLKGGRVLLLQDESGRASGLAEGLRQRGCHVMVAKSSSKFFEMALNMQPDIILLHLMSSLIDGPALCCALKADARVSDIPVILVTGVSSAGSRVKGLEAGAVDHVEAPFDLREILLRMAIHRRGRRASALVGRAGK